MECSLLRGHQRGGTCGDFSTTHNYTINKGRHSQHRRTRQALNALCVERGVRAAQCMSPSAVGAISRAKPVSYPKLECRNPKTARVTKSARRVATMTQVTAQRPAPASRFWPQVPAAMMRGKGALSMAARPPPQAWLANCLHPNRVVTVTTYVTLPAAPTELEPRVEARGSPLCHTPRACKPPDLLIDGSASSHGRRVSSACEPSPGAHRGNSSGLFIEGGALR
jgi:hypothetical protein